MIYRTSSRIMQEASFVRNYAKKIWRKLYKSQHQLTSTTQFDRYPELFNEVSRVWGKVDRHPRILSFGCSTGEECSTLNKYFRDADIIGADINRSNLTIARKRNELRNVRFVDSTHDSIRMEGPYDIIFCLSVLCRWEDTKDLENCEKVYSFMRFGEITKELSCVLVSGGLFVIYNSNFRFEDTPVFLTDGYESVLTPAVTDSGFVHKFDRMNRRIHGVHPTCVYRKGPN